MQSVVSLIRMDWSLPQLYHLTFKASTKECNDQAQIKTHPQAS